MLFTFKVCLLIFQASSQAQDFNNKGHSKETAEFDRKLILADQNRRANPVLFKQKIDELKQTEIQLTSEQKYYLTLLEGHYFAYSGEYDKAKNKLQFILNSNANKQIKHRANHTLIMISAAEKDWSKGLTYLRQNIKFLPKLKSREHYQNTLLVSILFYNQLKQYKLALKYSKFLTSETLSSKDNCLWYQLTLEAQFYTNQLTATDKRINNAINACQEANYNAASNIIRLYKAKIFLIDNQPSEAIALLLTYLEEINNIRYPMLIAEANNIIGKAYWELGDINSAEKHANEAKDTNKALTIIKQAADTYKLLFQIAKADENHQQALEYHEQYAKLDKANLDETKAKHLAFQLAEHQAFEQESQIKLLNEQNNALAAEQALAKTEAANKKLIILSLALIILVLSVLGFRFYRAHKRVKELAEYDPLTGIFNRGHFTHVTESALKYCKNAQQDLSLIMFDLDHFKKINDSFGHGCGDWALKETIKVCKSIGRQNDIFARLGGEEFCLLLTSCDKQAALQRAEACRKAIAEIDTNDSGFDFTVTASFGITDVETSGYDLEKLLADADSAAYASKHAGRNKVTLYQNSEQESDKKVVTLDNSRNAF